MTELMKDFVSGYCERSGITEQRYHEMKVTLPCVCDVVEGPHWAAVTRDPAGILDHLAFHCPAQAQLLEMSHDETKHILADSAGRKSVMLTPQAERNLERVWELRREAIVLLGHVVAEWNSDPMSVQCFDERIVKRSKEVLAELKRRDIFNDL